MPLNTNIDTRDLEPVTVQVPRFSPPIPSSQGPPRNPFYVGAYPLVASTNSDAVWNFQQTNVPTNRIVPLPSLSQPGLGNNSAVAPVAVTKPSLLTPTPAPTIASPLTATPTGFTFSFNEIRLAANTGFSIVNYRIYRGTSSVSAAAVLFLTLPHSPASIGRPVTVQDAQPNGTSFCYFVSAVNSQGQESNLTPAQNAPVTTNSIANANSQLASSFHNNVLNVASAPLSATTISNSGGTTATTVSAFTSQFGSGQISYNSSSFDPGSFAVWAVYYDDPAFVGGPVAPGVTSVALGVGIQVAADGRMPVGAIALTLGSASTGGGTTGGTTQSPAGGGAGIAAAGGKGFLQL
jgi:hypothetical protein